ncbi:hypothetical protein [Actinocorallia aurantiaca]|uniref:Secreted protein n=1 Tax=Actinocorallia aurantiaca TaxID=46204 RepID=A0ABN3UBL3_9ACTN
MNVRKVLGMVVACGLLVTAPAVSAEAAPKPKVLKVTPKLKGKLAKLFHAKVRGYGGKYKKLRNTDVHYGRIGDRYWALSCLYYADSPVGATDCGTTFTRKGSRGVWKIKSLDGGFFCPAVPMPLYRAWKLKGTPC